MQIIYTVYAFTVRSSDDDGVVLTLSTKQQQRAERRINDPSDLAITIEAVFYTSGLQFAGSRV